MIYEHRHYHPAPGQFERLKARFREHTAQLFEQFGIRAVGYWETVAGEMWNLHYLLEWESLAEREQVWEVFANSAEWRAIRERTEADGPLVASLSIEFWRPTDFSPAGTLAPRRA